MKKQSWVNLFEPIQNDIDTIITNLNDDTCPNKDAIFKCFDYFDVLDTKVVIIGQDPYHSKDTATGLSFEAINKKPPSLMNIFKAVRNTYPDAKCNIEHWASQGVLMLNRALTVELNKPNSHNKYWKHITNKMVSILSEYLKNNNVKLVFFLWGKNAQELIPFIDTSFHTVLTYTHPSPLSRVPFINCDHFRICNTIHDINW